MSGYLNRLIRRTQAARESPFLQPFVRSTSPIAQQDQRLSVAGFEDSESRVFTPADGDTDGDLGPAGEAQALTTPDITASREVTVQRKIASPNPGSLTPTPPIAANASPASRPGVSNSPSVKAKVDRSNQREFLGREHVEPLTPSSSEPGASVQDNRRQGSIASARPSMAEPHDRGQVHPQTPAVQPQQLRRTLGLPALSAIALEPPIVNTPQPAATVATPHAVVETQPSAAAPVSTPVAVPSPGRSETQDVEQQIVRLDNIRSRSALQKRPGPLPVLEPSMRSLVDRDEQPFAEAPIATLDRQEGPQVVIGRINVEVVPQTAPEATVTPSRSGPLTAASVSVIGPLGGGVSSNLRLSLRQR